MARDERLRNRRVVLTMLLLQAKHGFLITAGVKNAARGLCIDGQHSHDWWPFLCLRFTVRGFAKSDAVVIKVLAIPTHLIRHTTG